MEMGMASIKKNRYSLNLQDITNSKARTEGKFPSKALDNWYCRGYDS